MNWLDRAINFFSPAAGLRRSRLRAAQSVMLSYEGARTGRRQGGWAPSGASGNAEMGPAMAGLRNNAEDLVQNNSFAAKATRRWARRTVGYGITPQADTGSAAANEVLDAAWREWGAVCCSDRRLNIYAVQRLVSRTAFVRGECLIRLWDRSLEDGLPVPFQLQVLEPDYLDGSKTQQLKSGYIIQGVQFDSIGRIQGYWLFGTHPGEPVQTSARGLTSAFVPADRVLHHCALERPGDARAVSRFAPVIRKLRDVDEYADAEIVRKKIEACFTALITQPEGPDGPTLGAKVTDAYGKPVERFEPGMLMYGTAGMDAKPMAPASSGDYATHKKVELREISAGLDLPYVIVGDDLSDVNYSSFRGGAIDERDAVDEYRWLWFIPQVCDPIWRKFVDTMFVLGRIPERNYGVKWNPPPFDLLDREAEAKADQLELQLGKTTWPQLVGRQGQDPEKQIAEIAAWKPRLADAGVTFTKQGVANEQNQSTPA